MFTVFSSLPAQSGGMRARYRLQPPELEAAHHQRYAAERTSDLLGFWFFLGAVLVVVAVGAVLTYLHAPGAGAIAIFNLIMIGIVMASAPLVLSAIRRADRAADQRALRHFEAAQRIHGAGEEILAELAQVNSGLAKLAARIETVNIRCRAVDGAGQDERNHSS
jgi:hypothetical protein